MAKKISDLNPVVSPSDEDEILIQDNSLPVGTRSRRITVGNFLLAVRTSIADHLANFANPHNVTKTQVGLGNVTNDAQLKIASNLADLDNTITARANLGVGTASVATNTINGLINLQVPDASTDQQVTVMGYYAAGDGGGGLFDWNPALKDSVTYVKLPGTTLQGTGTGYVVNDLLTVSGGTGTACTIQVTQIDVGGVIRGVKIIDAGSYDNPPVNPVTLLGGTGTGATVNLVYKGQGGTVFTPVGRTTAGRWVRVYQGLLDPRWFGAKGNGTTDDTDALRRTLINGSCLLSPGNYPVRSNINLNSISERLIAGQGNQTIIKQVSEAPSLPAVEGPDYLLGLYACSNFTIDNVTFDVNYLGSQTIRPNFSIVKIESIVSPAVSQTTNITVRNCHVIDTTFMTGVTGSGYYPNNTGTDNKSQYSFISLGNAKVSNLVVQGNNIEAPLQIIRGGQDTAHVVISDNISNYASSSAIDLGTQDLINPGLVNCSISNNIIRNPLLKGINIEPLSTNTTGAYVYQLRISDNTISGLARAQFFTSGAVNDTAMVFCGDDCIQTGVPHNLVPGNRIRIHSDSNTDDASGFRFNHAYYVVNTTTFTFQITDTNPFTAGWSPMIGMSAVSTTLKVSLVLDDNPNAIFDQTHVTIDDSIFTLVNGTHKLVEGDQIVFDGPGNPTDSDGESLYDNKYYVTRPRNSTFKIAKSKVNALAGIPMTGINANGTVGITVTQNLKAVTGVGIMVAAQQSYNRLITITNNSISGYSSKDDNSYGIQCIRNQTGFDYLENTLIEGNQIKDCGTAFSLSHLRSSRVANNIINTAEAGIIIGFAEDLMVQGNIIQDCFASGIKLGDDKANNVQIRSNTVLNCGNSKGKGAVAIVPLSDSVLNIMVVDNDIYDNRDLMLASVPVTINNGYFEINRNYPLKNQDRIIFQGEGTPIGFSYNTNYYLRDVIEDVTITRFKISRNPGSSILTGLTGGTNIKVSGARQQHGISVSGTQAAKVIYRTIIRDNRIFNSVGRCIKFDTGNYPNVQKDVTTTGTRFQVTNGDHNMEIGEGIFFEGTGSTVGYTFGVIYYVIPTRDSDKFKIATTYNNAINKVAVATVSGGTNITFTQAEKLEINSTSNKFVLSTASKRKFNVGDVVAIKGTDTPSGYAFDTKYFITQVSTEEGLQSFKLASSYRNASNGIHLTISGGGADIKGIFYNSYANYIYDNDFRENNEDTISLQADKFYTWSNLGLANENFRTYRRSFTWDPASITNGASLSTNYSVTDFNTDLVKGDIVTCDMPDLPDGVFMNGKVVSTNTIRVTIFNQSGSTQDIPSGTVKVQVNKEIPY